MHPTALKSSAIDVNTARAEHPAVTIIISGLALVEGFLSHKTDRKIKLHANVADIAVIIPFTIRDKESAIAFHSSHVLSFIACP